MFLVSSSVLVSPLLELTDPQRLRGDHCSSSYSTTEPCSEGASRDIGTRYADGSYTRPPLAAPSIPLPGGKRVIPYIGCVTTPLHQGGQVFPYGLWYVLLLGDWGGLYKVRRLTSCGLWYVLFSHIASMFLPDICVEFGAQTIGCSCELVSATSEPQSIACTCELVLATFDQIRLPKLNCFPAELPSSILLNIGVPSGIETVGFRLLQRSSNDTCQTCCCSTSDCLILNDTFNASLLQCTSEEPLERPLKARIA
jgi:hypothetical protein